MAKKALVDTNESIGQDARGYPVVDVVDVGNEFETHSSLEWKSCGDDIKTGYYWWDPTTSTFRELPEYLDPSEDAGALATDADGNPTEEYVWSWTTDTYSKQSIS